MGFMGGGDPVSSAILTLGAGLLGGNDAPEAPQVQQNPLLTALTPELAALLKQNLSQVKGATSPETLAAAQAYFDKMQNTNQKPTPYTYANTGLTQNPANTSAPVAPTAPTAAKTVKQGKKIDINAFNKDLKGLLGTKKVYTQMMGNAPVTVTATELTPQAAMTLMNKYGLEGSGIQDVLTGGGYGTSPKGVGSYAQFGPNKDAWISAFQNSSNKQKIIDQMGAKDEAEAIKWAKLYYGMKGGQFDSSLGDLLSTEQEVANPEYEAAMKKYEADVKAFNDAQAAAKAKPITPPVDQTQTGQFPSTTQPAQTTGAQNPLVAALAQATANQTSYKPALQQTYQQAQSNYPKLPADIPYADLKNQAAGQKIMSDQATVKTNQDDLNSKFMNYIKNGGTADYDVWKNQGTPTAPSYAEQMATAQRQAVTYPTVSQPQATAPQPTTPQPATPQPATPQPATPQPTTPKINTQPAQSAGQTLDPAQKTQNNAQFDVAKTFAANNGVFNDYYNPENMRPKTATDYSGQMVLGTDPLETALQANFISKLDKEYLPATDIAEAQQGVKQLISAPNTSSADIANLDAAAGRLGQTVNMGPTANEELARQQLKQRMVSGTGSNLADTLYQQAMNPYMRELRDQQTQSANSLAARGLGNSTIVNNVNENLNKVYADRAKDIALGSQVEATKMNEAAIMDALNQSGALESAIKNAQLAGNAQNQAGAQGQANIYTTQNNMRRSDQADKANLLNQSVNMALQRQNADQTALGNLQDIMTKQENRRIFNIQNPQNIWQQNVNNNQNTVSQAINAANGIGVPLTSMQNQNNMAGYQQQIAGQTQMNQLLGQVGAGLFGNKGGSNSYNNVSNPFDKVEVPDSFSGLGNAGGVTYSPYKPMSTRPSGY